MLEEIRLAYISVVIEIWKITDDNRLEIYNRAIGRYIDKAEAYRIALQYNGQ